MLGQPVTALTDNAIARVSATCRGVVGFTIGPSYRCARDPEEPPTRRVASGRHRRVDAPALRRGGRERERAPRVPLRSERNARRDRKSTRLNSSHITISYAV